MDAEGQRILLTLCKLMGEMWKLELLEPRETVLRDYYAATSKVSWQDKAIDVNKYRKSK